MRPDFATRIDPLFIAVQVLLDRISMGETLVCSDVRRDLVLLLDKAESAFGDTEEWQLTKYALCCWIDSQLIAAPWEERTWWAEHCIEKKIFGIRRAHIEYFLKAKIAARQSRDALEVYYLGVIMGFRGFYNDDNSESQARKLMLPVSLQEWCSETALALRLRQGRPEVDDKPGSQGSARPQTGLQSLTTTAFVAVLMIAIAIAFFLIFGSELGAKFLSAGVS